MAREMRLGREGGREGGLNSELVVLGLDPSRADGEGDEAREGGREGGTYRPLCSTREGKDSRPRIRVQEVRKCRT